ncbi:MFS transporter [Limimaricola cinnabarinus]|uniref:MFS transporter n=1 Tax=Limimaricola cinnabarinus TaxID=1125964 RepID=UPI00269D4AFE
MSLILVLLLFAENAAGVTLLGHPPALGLDPEMREGTRATGPIIAAWYAVFIIPFFAWVRDAGPVARARVTPRLIAARLAETLRDVMRRPSLAAFLAASMLYRDALAAIYAFGGLYATLVLGWSVIEIGVFGIIGAVAAAVLTWAGGLADARTGPKPVIRASVWVLIAVSVLVVSMNRDSLFGVALAPGSKLPDILFYVCGALIGGAGGALYAASRSLMVRHADPARATEAFGLFALSGRATAFLAPMAITFATWMSGSVRAGLVPVIALFALALFLLGWVNKNGDRAA